MSSEISTEQVRSSVSGVRPQPDQSTLEPWQFFVLAALGCATAALFASRGQGVTAVVLLTVLMGATALVGIAALRTLRPLVSAEEERTVMVGHRTRVALEREKMLALRAIKELEFDRAMGKVSEKDFVEMSGRLRARAVRLMRQLDAGAGYRSDIEREITKRIGHPMSGGSKEQDAVIAGSTKQDPAYAADRQSTEDVGRVLLSRPAVTCVSCNTTNDSDARFCKHCGAAMERRA
jgi:hypothetical protein